MPQPIVVERLSRVYTSKGKRIVALNDVSFVVGEGEVVGILGPNGAGKTTLCLILSGLLEPTKGTAYVMGEDVRKLKRKVCEKYVALYLSEYTQWDLSPRIPALKYLEIIGAMDGIEGDVKERARKALKSVDLWDWRDEWPTRFSAGMRRRLLLAALLMYDFPIMVLDEPTVHLDPASCVEVWKALKAIAKEGGKTVLLTTQNMEEAEYLCDRVMLLNEGRIIATGSTEYLKALTSRTEKIVIRVRSQPPELKRAIENLNGVLRVEEEGYATLIVEAAKGSVKPREIVDLAERFGIRILSLTYEKPSLSDVFRTLLKGDQA